HADLERSRLTGLVAPLLGQEVNAVTVSHVEPPFLGAGHPHLLVGGDGTSLLVLDARLENELAGRRRLAAARHEPARVRRAAAQLTDPLDLLDVLVCVEAADEALSVGVAFSLEDLDLHGRLRDRLAGEIHDGSHHPKVLLRRRPGFGLDSYEPGRGPERHTCRSGVYFTVRIAGFDLGHHVLR